MLRVVECPIILKSAAQQFFSSGSMYLLVVGGTFDYAVLTEAART